MKEKILQYFKLKKGIVNIKDIKKDLEISSDYELNEIITIINSLILQGEIYEVDNFKYQLFPKKSELMQGKLKRDKNGNYYIAGTNNCFISKKLLNGALEGDIVIVVKDDENSKIKTGYIKKIIARNSCGYVFEVKEDANNKILIPIGFELNDNIEFNNKEYKKLVDGTRVIVDIPLEKKNGKYFASITSEIGHKDDPDYLFKQIALENGVRIHFPQDVLDEVDLISETIDEKELEGRLDLRKETIFTIDGDGTKDIDDAISLVKNDRGNYVLGVHIANVSHYVKPGSKILEEAISRGNSFYSLNSSIPYLPRKLSNGICSLNERVDRLTKSCIMEIDPSGKVIDYKICDSIINSNKKMSYSNVNKILEKFTTVEGYEKYESTLKEMQILSNILEQKRLNQGKIDFYERELEITTDENGKVIDVHRTIRGSAERLIENFMIVTNETVANHYAYQPFIFRVHDKPREDALKSALEYIKSLNLGIKIPNNIYNSKVIQNILYKLKDVPEFPIVSDTLLKGLAKAFFDTENIGHFALALAYYAQFSSPIRRVDLINHILIDIYNGKIKGKEAEELIKRLKEICVKASNAEELSEKVEKKVIDVSTSNFLRDNVGKIFEATIILITSKQILIQLENGIIGNINTKKLCHNGFSYQEATKTFKCKDEILKTGSNISVTVLDPALNNNQIAFDITKRKEKTLKKTSNNF